MQIVQRYTIKDADKLTPKQAINRKMRILREFCVVNDNNADEVRAMLESSILSTPGRDYEIVLDQVTRKIIFNKLNGGN